MSISAVTPLYPALIKQQANISEKLVLISPVAEPVQPQFILVVPFFSPDGEVIEKRLTCVTTDRPMGRVLWNHTNRWMKLEPRPYFPSLATYFCLGERFHNPIKQPNLEFAWDCMRMSVFTPLYPALLKREADLSEPKLALISPAPGPGQPEFIVFEISIQDNDAKRWLELTHYAVNISTLSVPFFSPDGEVIQKRLICVFTARPMGRVLWNQTDRGPKLVDPIPRPSAMKAYFCIAERFDNQIKQPNLSDTDIYMVPSSEDALLSSSMPEYLAMMVEDELPHHVEMPEPQAIKVDDDILNILSPATPEHHLAHLLPDDPFDMGFT